MAIRLVVLDIDGTIAGESNEVRPGVLAAIERVQGKGIPVALATGRMFPSALRFHAQIQSPLPVITYNGALTQCPHTGQIVRECALPSAIALELVDYLEQPNFREELEIHCYYNDQLHVREITPETHRYEARSGMKAQAVGDLRPFVAQKTPKLLAVSQNTPLLEQLQGILEQRFSTESLYVTQSTPIYLEMTHPEATKGHAVRHLAESVLGLTADEVLAIGDNFNDVEMLTYAGIGVAMGNAPTGVKACADWVTADVEADGVTLALERFC